MLVADQKNFDGKFRKFGIAEHQCADELVEMLEFLEHAPGPVLARRRFHDVRVRADLDPREEKREGQCTQHTDLV